MSKQFGVHWFRRDLRVAGNSALQENWRRQGGRVVGFFCFDQKFLARSDFSKNRFAFFLETLVALRDELREIGSDLLVWDDGPDQAFDGLRAKLAARGVKPSLISWNRDYEPFARERDDRLFRFFRDQWGVPVHTDRDHVLIEPEEIKKDDAPASPYQIYTPYSRKWLAKFATTEVRERVQVQTKGLNYLRARAAGKAQKVFSLDWPEVLGKSGDLGDVLDIYHQRLKASATVPIPKAGSLAALAALERFRPKIDDYGDARDIPSTAGTSQFSIYFKNGSLTVAQAIAFYGLEPYAKKAADGSQKFLSELIWREFYYYILTSFPYVETRAFNPKYDGLAWENRASHFEAWKEGRTGFPIVDAGMRQLRETGWMHNRVRMIVASFLTKDLLIDYKWGERYFMEQLLDGDLAPNNGGWQWAASTGCDPQPYFRIFNPKLQSEKFDARGDYIKRYVPELARVTGKEIHEPSSIPSAKYPRPIVEHSVQRDRALQLYKDQRSL